VICVELDIVEALEAAVPDRYSALIVLAAGIGIRMYEALGLTLDRVDFLRRQVAIDLPVVRDGGDESKLGGVPSSPTRGAAPQTCRHTHCSNHSTN
jgi:hypothetical protein